MPLSQPVPKDINSLAKKACTAFHGRGKLETEASCRQTAERIAALARRRYQQPEPFVRGNWWILTYWQDVFEAGEIKRKKMWKKIAPSSASYRETKKLADEILRPLNTELSDVPSATPFRKMTHDYIEVILPTFAKPTRDRYLDVINKNLLPAFGSLSLRDVTPQTVQQYFSGLGPLNLARASMEKILTVLRSIFKISIAWNLLSENPAKNVLLLDDHRGEITKPHLTAVQFFTLLAHLTEPYATMV